MINQPLYSSDLDPETFLSFPNSRGELKGTHLKDSTTIKRVKTKEFRAERSWKNPPRSEWKHEGRECKSASGVKKIGLKRTCCNFEFLIVIK